MRIIILFFLFSVCLVSCKKKKEDPTTSTQNTSSPWAYCKAVRYYEDTLGVSTLSDSTVNAMFFSQQGYNAANAVNVGNLALKGSAIPYISGWYYSVGTHNVSGDLVWSAPGSGPFPAFTYTQTTPFPSYNGASILQDTILRTARATFTINNISGANSVTALLVHPAAPSGGYYKTVINDTVSFAPNEYDHGINPICLTVYIYKVDSVSVNNIFYQFMRGVEYRKVIYLKP